MEPTEIRQLRVDFHRRLRERQLLEGYSYDEGNFVTRPYWPLEPKNHILPHVWRWDEIRPLVLECGEMVGLGHGTNKYDRRVLALSNPGSNGDFTLSGPLFGDIQLIRPGEAAPCHRHTPCATRFVLEGQGGWTTVSGEKIRLAPGDIVYTGQFPWHDHGNDGPDDFIFLDVLDIPLLYFTATSSWEFDYETITGSRDNVHQPVHVSDFSNQLLVKSDLQPAFATPSRRKISDMAHLAWQDARPSLVAFGSQRGSHYDGIRMQFRNAEGGTIGATVAVHTQWLRPNESTLAHRHTGAFIYVCVEGRGRIIINDVAYDFGPCDIFVVPSWHWHAFETVEGCFLHSISDLALIQKMGLYREQRRTEAGEVQDSGWTSNVEHFES